MTIKVNYDITTTKVKGYYPDSINYASIPEPFIEITDGEHQEALGKTMCVVGGIFQEYVTPDSVLLEQGKQSKTAQCQAYLEGTDWQAAAFIKYSRPVDANVSENCLKAKQWKIDIAACTTLEELNAININFN
jgi:hypothetical protein